MDKENVSQQAVYELCDQDFKSLNDKDRHHHHNKKEIDFVGAYCGRCNMNIKGNSSKLTVLAHNINYDTGLILKEMNQNFPIYLLYKQTHFFSVYIGKSLTVLD